MASEGAREDGEKAGLRRCTAHRHRDKDGFSLTTGSNSFQLGAGKVSRSELRV